MKPTDIITIARQQSNVTIDTVTEAQAFMYLNIVIQDFWRDIANREKMYEEVTQTDNTV
ncbi:MAG: hypothetical protein GY861_24515 [bacterium]|nr:hypothetical protein [bacterium]